MPAYYVQDDGNIVIDNYSIHVTIGMGQTTNNTCTAYINATATNPFDTDGTVQINYVLLTGGASSNLNTGSQTLTINLSGGTGSANRSHTFTDTNHNTISLYAKAVNSATANYNGNGPLASTPQGSGYMSVIACSGKIYEGGGGGSTITQPTWANVYDLNTWNSQYTSTSPSQPAKYTSSTTKNFTVRWGGATGATSYNINVTRYSGTGDAGPWNYYGVTDTYLNDQFNQAAGSIYKYTITAVGASGTSTAIAYVQVIDSSYQVTATSTNTSRGSASGGGAYTAGTSVTVTATPKAGYVFGGWTLTGLSASSSTSNPYTFSMPSNAVTAKATFWRCVYVYRNSSWQAAIPYVYRSGWKRAEHWVYRGGEWT